LTELQSYYFTFIISIYYRHKSLNQCIKLYTLPGNFQ